MNEQEFQNMYHFLKRFGPPRNPDESKGERVTQIKVNKRCRISQEGHFKDHYADCTVLNVSALDDSCGFVQFILAYSTDQNCCEQCEHHTDIDDKEPFVATVEKIEVEEESHLYESMEGSPFSEYGLDGGGCVGFAVYTDQGVFKGFIANDQNGYYSHYAGWSVDEMGKETLTYEADI